MPCYNFDIFGVVRLTFTLFLATLLAVLVKLWGSMPTKIQNSPSRASIHERDQLNKFTAGQLAEMFSLLANDTRLRLLHAVIRAKVICAGDIAKALGMKPQAISNQLQLLSARRVLTSERSGNQIYYKILDPCVVELLERGLCLSEDAGATNGY